jgi:hypothetical protein
VHPRCRRPSGLRPQPSGHQSGVPAEIRVVDRPDHGLTIRDVFRIDTRDREEVPRLLTGPRMSESWKRWAADWLQKRKSQPTEASDPGCCEA